MQRSPHVLAVLLALSPTLAPAATYLTQVAVVPTGATPVYDGGTPSGINTSAFGSVFAPINHVSAPGIVVTGDATGVGRAFADIGTLRVYSRAAQGVQGGTLDYYTNDIFAQSRAQFVLDDVVITAPAGNQQTFVNMSLRFSMSGLMPDPDAQGGIYDTALIASAPTQTFATVDDQLLLDIGFRDPAGTFTGFGGGSARVTASATNAAGSTTEAMLATGSFSYQSAALQSGAPFIAEAFFIGVPIGRPLELTVGMRAIAKSVFGFPVNGGVWQGNGTVAFDHSLTFAPDAVATLPAGFTINSVSGRIVDNTWSPAPVPLPGAAWLFSAGIAGVLVRARRRAAQ